MKSSKKNNPIKIQPKIVLRSNPKLFFAVFIISAAVLAFEIMLIRISSIIFTFNYVFMIVSIAILGMGCGGIFSFYKWRSKEIQILNNFHNILLLYSGLFTFSVLLFTIFLTYIHFFTYIVPFFLISFLPFFFAGAMRAIIFRALPQEGFRIYAFDLLGGSTGVILVILSLNKFSGTDIVLFISILGSITSFLFLERTDPKRESLKRRFGLVSTIFLISILLFTTNISIGFFKEIPVRNEPAKELSVILNNTKSKIIESRWSPFGRTDLVQFLETDRHMSLFIDGTAGTSMYKFDNITKNIYNNTYFIQNGLSGAFPFLFMNDNARDSMLIIGPGGGREVLLGLINMVKNIKGIEINQDFIDVVKEYKDYNGGIYTDFKNIEIINSEGRDYVRNSNEKFDIILVTLPNTKSSRSIEGYALTENYLLTIESIKDYFNHLTDDGLIIATLHDYTEVMRFFVISLVSLEELGIENKEAMKYLYTVSRDMMPPLVVLKRNPVTTEEANKIFEQSQVMGFDSLQNYIPNIDQAIVTTKNSDGSATENYMFNNYLVALSKGEISLKDLIKTSYYDISPVSDNRPFFFYDIKNRMPGNLLFLLIIALIVNFSVVIRPIMIWKARKGFLKVMSLFLLLGAGFMLIEISFFQKLTFYMSSPTISLGVILTSLLSGMGIGSFTSKKIFYGQSIKRLILFCLLIFIIITALFFTVPFIMDMIKSGILIKAIVASLILIPVGFILGVPFPTGINLAKEMELENSITWLYGINGTMSVLGSIIAMILSTNFGFTVSLISGTCIYLTIAVIFLFNRKTV